MNIQKYLWPTKFCKIFHAPPLFSHIILLYYCYSCHTCSCILSLPGILSPLSYYPTPWILSPWVTIPPHGYYPPWVTITPQDTIPLRYYPTPWILSPWVTNTPLDTILWDTITPQDTIPWDTITPWDTIPHEILSLPRILSPWDTITSWNNIPWDNITPQDTIPWDTITPRDTIPLRYYHSLGYYPLRYYHSPGYYPPVQDSITPYAHVQQKPALLSEMLFYTGICLTGVVNTKDSHCVLKQQNEDVSCKTSCFYHLF